MKISNFQFTTPMLMKFDYDVNNDFKHTDTEIEMEVHLDVNVNRLDNKNEAIVELYIQIGEEDGTTPFCIKVIEGARFKWDDGEYSESDINNLLHKNAPSLLLSYVRPIIASVTSMTPFDTYKLPFINFNDN
ncbi:MAG: hypothetical protein HFG29_01455 [Eubacterium sp.]|nr:hypothetical protein [Eubacterium sp.]